MNKKMMVLLSAVAVVLVTAAVLFFIPGNRSGEEQQASAGKTTALERERTTKDKSPSGEEDTYNQVSTDAGEWDIPVPQINPLYRQEAYSSVDYKPVQTLDIQYIDDNNTLQDRTINGETWMLNVHAEKVEVERFNQLKAYISNIGGKIWHTTSSSMVIMYEPGDGTVWWAVAEPDHDTYELLVIKEDILTAGEAMTIKTADFPERTVRFSTYNLSGVFQSMEVGFPDAVGNLTIDATQRILNGKSYRRTSFNRVLYACKSDRFVLNCIPGHPGSVEWVLSWSEDEDPGEVTIVLKETASLSPVSSGEDLGVLCVRGVPGGSVRVEIPEDDSIEHPDFSYSSLEGDVSADGDTIFWLPGGYYNVVFGPQGSSSVSAYRTMLVPVHPAKTTILDIPPSWELVFKRMEGDFRMQSGITITGTHENGETAAIDFELQERKDQNMVPASSNTEVIEGGSPAKIVSIDRIPVPPSVVLLLDSSGSMRGQMEQTLHAAKEFIRGLPDDTYIRVVDFDTSPKLLPGSTKQQALNGLDTLKAGGATALYDSITEALGLLDKKDRPALVVFTDGVDANADDTGPGSYASLDEVIEDVRDANIPLYTIGFGPKHDNTVLLTLADLSGGRYYPADDHEALDKVFEAISGKLGNAFRVTYKRPQSIASADTPVVSIVLDTSGSMDTDPEEEGCGYRIDKVKNLFNDFILQLPEDSIIQLSSFNDDVTVSQAMTDNRAELLKALGRLEAGGGTEIKTAVRTVFETMKPVPSTKKVMIFLTDAALVDGSEDEEFDMLLEEIYEDNIEVLWVGMGVEQDNEAFKRAAEKTGGEYVISEDSTVLQDAFDRVLSSIENKGNSSKTALTLRITKDSDEDESRTYSASTVVDFSASHSGEKTYEIEAVRHRVLVKESVQLYDKELSELIYGTDVPRKDTQVFRRIPLSAKGQNNAMKLSVSGAAWLDRIKGVEAPEGMRILSLDMEFTNRTEESIPYVIPDMCVHFFLNLNNEGMYPASKITWLAESPVSVPGEAGILLEPDETRKGVMMFLVPDASMKQGSLHFYDTENGHIILPLAGKIKHTDIVIKRMPESVSGRLSDSFTLTVTGYKDMDETGDVKLQEDALFRVVEGKMSSRVQALLALDPQERMSLRVFTDKGPFRIPLDNASASLPFGFVNPVMLAPASENTIRMAFQIPSGLSGEYPCELVMDLQDEDFTLPLGDEPDWTYPEDSIKGDGLRMCVNTVKKTDTAAGYYDNYVVADITLNDIKDGFGTVGLQEAFFLVRDDYEESGYDLELSTEEVKGSKGLGNFASGSANSEMEGVVTPDYYSNDELITGIDQDWALLDGESRRGLILFIMPDGWQEHDWTLHSTLFTELAKAVQDEDYEETWLLAAAAQTQNYDMIEFEEQLYDELPAAISRYRNSLASGYNSASAAHAGINAEMDAPQHITAPITCQYGTARLKQVDTPENFLAIMRSLRWLPLDSYYCNNKYSPEAVLTQGWGNQIDLLILAEGLLSGIGLVPERRTVLLNEKGLEELSRISGISGLEMEELPAVEYRDKGGSKHIFVIPFMKDITELSGMVYLSPDRYAIDVYEPEATITVMIDVTAKDPDLAAHTMDAANALAGSDGTAIPPESFTVLEKTLPLKTLSMDAVDIGYAVVGQEKGDLYTAVMDTPQGRFPGLLGIDEGRYEIMGACVVVELPDSKKEHVVTLREGESLTDIFHTLGINLPDLPSYSAESLDRAANGFYENAQNPDALSALRWHNRGVLNRFIAAQTRFELDICEGLELITGRTKTERCIMVTNRIKTQGSPFVTSIDLLQQMSDVHEGNEQAKNSFAIMTGIMASHLEGAAMPGSGMDFADIWDRCPEGTKFLMSYGRLADSQELVDHMEDTNYPDFLVQRVQDSEKVMMFPDRASIINGEQRWAWLEIDPDTYETIAVIDTGEHGAMVEYNVTLAPQGESYRDYIAGAFTGVLTSVWAVADYSLMLDDYSEILKNAKTLALGIGKTIKGVLGGTGLAKGEIGVGPGKFSAKSTMDGWTVNVNQSVLGFNKGFQDGVEYYFSKAD